MFKFKHVYEKKMLILSDSLYNTIQYNKVVTHIMSVSLQNRRRGHSLVANGKSEIKKLNAAGCCTIHGIFELNATICYRFSNYVFTARCTIVHSVVLRSHVVCPSVCQSVTLVDCDHIGWNSSKIISQLVSVGRLLSADPNIMDLL